MSFRLLLQFALSFSLAQGSLFSSTKCSLSSLDTPECPAAGGLPVCVGIRSNGDRIFAHFPALARVVEATGPIYGVAGASSASISAWILESIHINPLVTKCGIKQCCSDQEQRARISFMLKGFQGFPLLSLLDPIGAIPTIAAQIVLQDIPGRLARGDLSAIEDLVSLLRSEINLLKIINPGMIELLLTSPDPLYHATDIVQLILSGLDFNVEEDVLIFFRPGFISFEGLMDVFDIYASFYAGYFPLNKRHMQKILTNCAVPSLGQNWTVIQDIPMKGSTCGKEWKKLFSGFARFRMSWMPSRTTDPMGKHMPTLVAASVVVDDAAQQWFAALEQYENAERQVDFAPSFEDLRFGYFGDQTSLDRVEDTLLQNYNDTKSRKFLSLGSSLWRDALITSPAEPSLDRGVVLDGNMVALGGWNDPVPAQVLRSMGCDRVVLVNRPRGAGSFARDVATLLGASPDDLASLDNLTDINSSWTQALLSQDVSFCGDWDAATRFDFDELYAVGYDGPFLSNDTCMRSLFGSSIVDTAIGGCTPLVPRT